MCIQYGNGSLPLVACSLGSTRAHGLWRSTSHSCATGLEACCRTGKCILQLIVSGQRSIHNTKRSASSCSCFLHWPHQCGMSVLNASLQATTRHSKFTQVWWKNDMMATSDDTGAVNLLMSKLCCARCTCTVSPCERPVCVAYSSASSVSMRSINETSLSWINPSVISFFLTWIHSQYAR